MLEFLFWYIAGLIWFVTAVYVASERGWLDPIANSRAMRWVDRWIGPAWRWVYRLTGAEALDRVIEDRHRQKRAIEFVDLADRCDAAGLNHAAEMLRTAAGELTAD